MYYDVPNEVEALKKARKFLKKNYNKAKMPNGLKSSEFIEFSKPTKTEDLFDKLRKRYPMEK